MNLQTKLKDTKLNCPAGGTKKSAVLRSTASFTCEISRKKTSFRNTANEKLRNINRKERKRLNEKAKYWEGIAIKISTEMNIRCNCQNP